MPEGIRRRPAAPQFLLKGLVDLADIMPQGGQSSQQAAAFPGAPVVVLVRQDGPCGHVRRHGTDGIETASVPDYPQELAVISAVDPMTGHGRILARRLAQQARHDGKAIPVMGVCQTRSPQRSPN